MRSLKIWIVLVVLLPLGSEAVKSYFPQPVDPIHEPWRWRDEENLSGLGALCMDRDADGVFWFGCAGSLARYDGRSVEQTFFDADLLSKITARAAVPWAKAILVLDNGDLLLLIGESLVLRSGSEWRVIIQDTGPSVYFCHLAQAEDGNIWLQVPGALWLVSPDLKRYEKVIAPTAGKMELRSFCLDEQGNPWVVEKHGNNSATLVKIPLRNGVPSAEMDWELIPIPFPNDREVTQIVGGKNGIIWYADASSKSAFEAYDSTSRRWLDMPKLEVGGGIYWLINGPDGAVWGGGEGQMFRGNPDRREVHQYTQAQLNLPLIPFRLFSFDDDQLWLIGRMGSVYSVDLGNSEWETYANLNFQCESHGGRTRWFLSPGGKEVICQDVESDKWVIYASEDQLIDRGHSLYASSHGFIWMSGEHEGRAALAVFNGKEWKRFLHPTFAQFIEPNAVFEASDSTVWFGAGGLLLNDSEEAGGALQYAVGPDGSVGLLKRHGNTTFPYYVISFAEVPAGKLIVGSTQVYAYDMETSRQSDLLEVPRENTVAMHVDSGKSLWIAKQFNRIFRFKGGEWTSFERGYGNGPPGSLLSEMLVLKDGSVMVATDEGISRFDGKTWSKNVYGKPFSMAKRWSGIRQTSDGSLWFSYAAYEDKHMYHMLGNTPVSRTIRHRPKNEPPETYFSSYLQKVAPPGNSHISWSGRDEWGQTPKEMLEFSWKLDDGEWSNYSKETGRMFPGLKHGEHKLVVSSRDQFYNVDPSPAEIVFSVLPPFWIRSWFIGMVVSIVGGTVAFIWMFVHFRMRRLEDRQEHLVEMDRLKTGFFTNVSHELRTPLTVMLGPLESLLDTETNDLKQKKLTMAIRNAQRISTLVNQLLDFRKIEEGVLEINPQEGDLIDAVREAIEILMPLAQSKGIECILEGDASCNGCFDADVLKKIVSNLVGNAIKYTDEGGQIRVRAFAGSQKDGQSRFNLIVEDSGMGISAENLEHVFERFYRIPERSMTDGAGIGLNLTRELVHVCHGDIRVESPVKDDPEHPGSRFTVVLPVKISTLAEG